MYEELKSSFSVTLQKCSDNLGNKVKASEAIRDAESADVMIKAIRQCIADYSQKSSEYKDFLKRQRTQESAIDLEAFQTKFCLELKVAEETITALNHILESSSNTTENSSTSSTDKRAQAEAARVKLEYARRELELKRKRALLEEKGKIDEAQCRRQQLECDADLELINYEKEAAAADAEATFLEQMNSLALDPNAAPFTPAASGLFGQQNQGQNKPHDPFYDVQRQSKLYGPNSNTTSRFHHQNRETPSSSYQSDNLATLFLRKDLITSRLYAFDENPGNFEAWKKSFKNAMFEMKASPEEELDILIKHLGKESSQYAISIRNANSATPMRGLHLLWERLEDRYGSEILVENAIREKLENFPNLTPKSDPKKLYELADLLDELSSIKENPKYASSLSFYDSPYGINIIARKLPYQIREQWGNEASNKEQTDQGKSPSFKFFCEFVRKVSKRKNNPNYMYDLERNQKITTTKTDFEQSNVECPIHLTNHPLPVCRTFKSKTWQQRLEYLKQNHLCFKCLISSTHSFKECPQEIRCDICGKSHNTAMHRRSDLSPSGEDDEEYQETIDSKCTKVCDKFGGRSCGKIVPIFVSKNGDKTTKKKVYAIIDDQSNRTLASTSLFDDFNIGYETESCYTLKTCGGTKTISCRQTNDLTVESIDGSFRVHLPSVVECNNIPDNRHEIPTPEVAKNHPHLKELAQKIPKEDPNAPICLLIGRDIPELHHVKKQFVGPPRAPFGQLTALGWVIIGDVCLQNQHQISTLKTSLERCDNVHSLHEEIFEKTPQDNVYAPSIDDRKFIEIMDTNFKMQPDGRWSAPLPFKQPEKISFSNRSQAYNRALAFEANLRKNESKKEHFFTFMEKILDSDCAEKVPQNSKTDKDNTWYLPLFGVYKKGCSNKIRGVFDSSATYNGVSLNHMLLQGPDLVNNLVGILLRFRQNAHPIMADIEQMFYQFRVHEDDRDYLRFFWYQDNDFNKPLIEYRMKVHVFGNSPSPAVATYGLRKAVSDSSEEVKNFVENNFYIDDGLMSSSDKEEIVRIVKDTQKALHDNGKIRMHKIAAIDKDVLEKFDKNDLCESLKEINLSDSSTQLPIHSCLGLKWNLQTDSFVIDTNTSQTTELPFTRRGVLSQLNGIYDPLGFIAPATIVGKIIFREASPDGKLWDATLPDKFDQVWNDWRHRLDKLDGIELPRRYTSESSVTSDSKYHIFCDASEEAIAAVAYVQCQNQIGFVMGKTKVAPSTGHTIPRLELCSAVLAVEIWSFISKQLNVPKDNAFFYSDSKVTLGYINNEQRRFHTYVSNRVDKIRLVTNPSQWKYVPSECNPADNATRSTRSELEVRVMSWLKGPNEFLLTKPCDDHFDLIDPDGDREIKPISSLKTETTPSKPNITSRFKKFSKWKNLVRSVAILHHVAQSFKLPKGVCQGWHVCPHVYANLIKVENFIIRNVQEEHFPTEINNLRNGKSVQTSSSIASLSPFLNKDGLLCVGGRIQPCETAMGFRSTHPVLIPKMSHLASLLIQHYHTEVQHQGRHFTEGAVRTAGYWIVGAKRLISSFISRCLTCKRLRGEFVSQKMANLPPARVLPSPPFSAVGVDVFGPWSVVSRRTRGGLANAKRWAVIFSCMSTRAIHIELLEEMTSSCFINALRRLVALRGPITNIFSDCGTNFVGTANELLLDKDENIRKYCLKFGICWKFNPPHASHMGGSWERMIGTVKKVLNSLLLFHKGNDLSHEVLSTFMAEVTGIVNSRPLTAISHDPENPMIISPNTILTMKTGKEVDLPQTEVWKDTYKTKWKHVQVLANHFWKHWKGDFLSSLQPKRKWFNEEPNVKEGNLVLVKDSEVHRNHWPLGVITKVLPSDQDSLVRSVEIRVIKNNVASFITRPVSEIVLLE